MIQFMLRLVVCVALTTALGTAVAKDTSRLSPPTSWQRPRPGPSIRHRPLRLALNWHKPWSTIKPEPGLQLSRYAQARGLRKRKRFASSSPTNSSVSGLIVSFRCKIHESAAA